LKGFDKEPVLEATFKAQIIYQNKVYNWAENIADAIELFEEMPVKTIIGKMADGETFEEFYWCQNIWKGIVSKQKTVILAICLAWINWKEKNA